ncbi:hypothetical protein [Arthrobacter sp. H14]|uniref:hypothetical protein n=1 Tax=Arthrobacter sp. H14 TaxID=1312959 RepID=UPI00047C29A7|nr:hypothetical protein [Arthrobacter sp. H14]
MTKTISRQPKGTTTGGQFAANTHTEPDVSLAPPRPADAAGIISANNDPVTLMYVAYDDQLNNQQIDMVLAGQWNDVANNVDEIFAEHALEEAERIAEQEINAAFDAETFDSQWDELDSDEQTEAISAVQDRDDSDPVADLLRNTPPQLMRTSLGSPASRLQDPNLALGSQLDAGGFEARQRALSELLEEAGMDTSPQSVHEEIEELVNEGPWDWHEAVDLDIIWYGDIQDGIARPRGDDENSGLKTLHFERAHVLLIDRINGSGHDVQIDASCSKTLLRPADDDPETDATGRVYLDSGTHGYSWNDVAGVHKPAYANGAPTAKWSE